MSKGIVVLIGAGPTSGVGIARTFVKNGYAAALLARSKDRIERAAKELREHGKAAAFASDTSSKSLKQAFEAIRSHADFKGLPVKVAIWHVKHSSKKPFLETTEDDFREAMETYCVGAYNFAKESITALKEGGGGTLIFTGTLGALRCNSQFASYGASRAAVRMLAQSLAREFTDQGIHVVHTIANGGIDDNASAQDIEQGKKMAAESVGKTYMWLAEQSKDLWIHEADLRPASEKF